MIETLWKILFAPILMILLTTVLHMSWRNKNKLWRGWIATFCVSYTYFYKMIWINIS